MKRWGVAVGAVGLTLLVLFVFGKSMGERVVWKIADKLSHGALRLENYIPERKLRSFGNYETHLLEMRRKLDGMSFEQFKEYEGRRLDLEIQMAQVMKRIIDSYRESGPSDR